MDDEVSDDECPAWQESSSDEDTDESDSDVDDDDIPAVNTTFSRLPEGTCWECPEGPVYDDENCGPRNLPGNFRSLSPGEIFELLWPLAMWELIVSHTNLYYAQECKGSGEKVKRSMFTTVREITTWVALQMMMVSNWTHNQDAYFTGRGPFDARLIMGRKLFSG